MVLPSSQKCNPPNQSDFFDPVLVFQRHEGWSWTDGLTAAQHSLLHHWPVQLHEGWKGQRWRWVWSHMWLNHSGTILLSCLWYRKKWYYDLLMIMYACRDWAWQTGCGDDQAPCVAEDTAALPPQSTQHSTSTLHPCCPQNPITAPWQ